MDSIGKFLATELAGAEKRSSYSIMTLTETIRAVQRNLGLTDDGVAGPKTWIAIAMKVCGLNVSLDPESLTTAVTKIPVSVISTSTPVGDKLASIAESQIGTEEDPQHQNRGSAILKYQQSTGLAGQGWPWCAAFIDWCVKQLSNIAPLQFERPRTASAFGLIDWARSQKLLIFSAGSNFEPQRGDLVVYEFSHCGIVVDVDANSRTFHAIEGNTAKGPDQRIRAQDREGFEVARQARSYSSVKKFIRLA